MNAERKRSNYLKLLDERRKVTRQAEEIAELKSRVKFLKSLINMIHKELEREEGAEL